MSDTGSKAPAKSDKTSVEAAPSRPWHPLEALHEEIDRLFADFGSGFPYFPFGRRRFWLRPLSKAAFDLSPAVDVVDKGNSYQITAELPGLGEKDVEIAVADDVLTIRGEKKEEKEERKKDFYRSERRFGSFERSFELPAGVDQGKIEASFKKGVLTITMPKTEEAQKKTKKIAITSK
jgi:HSP20 family protein